MQQATAFQYVNVRGASDELTNGAVGGQVHRFAAGGTLLVGDAVFISAANTVNKSATVGDYANFVGLSLIHISEPTRRTERSRMPSSA